MMPFHTRGAEDETDEVETESEGETEGGEVGEEEEIKKSKEAPAALPHPQTFRRRPLRVPPTPLHLR